MCIVEGLGLVVVVGVVWQWWALGGLLAFRAATLAQRSDLKEGMVDGRYPTERFIWLIDAGDDYAYGCHSPPLGHNHGCAFLLSFTFRLSTCVLVVRGGIGWVELYIIWLCL
jgi:hypothetical protein